MGYNGGFPGHSILCRGQIQYPLCYMHIAWLAIPTAFKKTRWIDMPENGQRFTLSLDLGLTRGSERRTFKELKCPHSTA